MLSATLNRARGAIHEIARHFWEALDVRNDSAGQLIEECIEELCGIRVDQKPVDFLQISLEVRGDFDRKLQASTSCHDARRQAPTLAARRRLIVCSADRASFTRPAATSSRPLPASSISKG